MYDEDISGMSDIDYDSTVRKNRLVDDLRALENEDTSSSLSYMPSSFLSSKTKKKKGKNNKDDDDWNSDPDGWFNELIGLSYDVKGNMSKKDMKDMFNEDGISGKKKKKKKKKKGNGEYIDYKQELQPEMHLYRNLMQDQQRFTDTLQKEYDSIKSVKSSARGVSKQMSDLIENITRARELSMHLVEKTVGIKKLAAELNMKQRKELGLDEGDSSITDYATNYLRQMINERKTVMGTNDNDTIEEFDSSDDMFFDLDTAFDDDRSEETDKLIEYENRNVTISVVITGDKLDEYEFEATAEDGEVIDDYPTPARTKLSINRSTNVATDEYGRKYPIIWK